MLETRIHHPFVQHITRRSLLQVGYSSAVGLGCSAFVNRGASTAETAGGTNGRRAKSVIVVFLTGASSHIDTFDPKPDAPAETRGEFSAIATQTPGIFLSEHLPRLAARSDKLAVVRSLSHGENNHLLATHQVLTGYAIPGGAFDQVASRNDYPCYASALDSLRPRHDGVPSGVTLPTFLVEGPLTWPGQHAGFLGQRHDPWHIRQDPNDAKFQVDILRLAEGITSDRLRQRETLLTEINRQREPSVTATDRSQFSIQQEQALEMLTSGQVSRAFDIHREAPEVRDRYGRHMFGQSLLLARRLVQAGVPIVQCNMGRVQNWDTHSDNFGRLKRELLPPLDQGVAALLDDLTSFGLLDETLVVMFGEFGRTPKISNVPGQNLAGRDHWAPVFSAVFAGAGVRGGQTIGRSDTIGAYPVSAKCAPADLAATIYDALGISHDAELRDRQSRPVALNRGQVIQPLYSGTST
jgi:uncharacterized protein (DUF1501 family)